MVHSDSQGFYLPQPMRRALIAPEGFDVAGNGIIGSSVSVIDDCVQLAKRLDLPIDLDPSSSEVQEAFTEQGKAESGWQRYGRESFACLSLHRAASASVQTGCALVFI